MLAMRGAIRFDRIESCGDFGADWPLIIDMIPAASLDSAGVFIVFRLLTDRHRRALPDRSGGRKKVVEADIDLRR